MSHGLFTALYYDDDIKDIKLGAFYLTMAIVLAVVCMLLHVPL